MFNLLWLISIFQAFEFSCTWFCGVIATPSSEAKACNGLGGDDVRKTMWWTEYSVWGTINCMLSKYWSLHKKKKRPSYIKDNPSVWKVFLILFFPRKMFRIILKTIEKRNEMKWNEISLLPLKYINWFQCEEHDIVVFVDDIWHSSVPSANTNK